MESITIHLRVPLDLKETIEERATAERRPWTQMAILMLQDAAAAWADALDKKGKKK